MGLREYKRKRDFRRTDEPEGDGRPRRRARRLRYLIQKHAASRLHYDFRLEWDRVLKSWAVPKGPSLDPKERRLAVHVEDHPLEYGSFEGTIPQGEYGEGTVMLWDRGYWVPVSDPRHGLKIGKLKFVLEGKRLRGGWMLVRMSGPRAENGKNWLLIKERDDASRPTAKGDIVTAEVRSVSSGRSMEEIATGAKRRRRAKPERARRAVGASAARRTRARPGRSSRTRS